MNVNKLQLEKEENKQKDFSFCFYDMWMMQFICVDDPIYRINHNANKIHEKYEAVFMLQKIIDDKESVYWVTLLLKVSYKVSYKLLCAVRMMNLQSSKLRHIVLS